MYIKWFLDCDDLGYVLTGFLCFVKKKTFVGTLKTIIISIDVYYMHLAIS